MADKLTESRGAPPASLDKIFNSLASSDLTKFEAFFRRMRGAYPQDLGRTCVRYLGTRGLDEAGRRVAQWLSSVPDYGSFLLDPALLTVPEAEQAAKIMRVRDGRFSVKMVDAFQQELGVEALNRALVILDATGNRSPFIPRLLALTAHTDERIRSKAVKALCELRPNYGLVKRQLESPDARVRANAVEALWHIPGEEARRVFCLAETDPHHRVVVNALLGLYEQKDTSSLDRLHELTSHPAALFRAAAMWALDRLRDRNSIPVLEGLREASQDVNVREKAKLILAEMAVHGAPETENRVTPEVENAGALPAAAAETLEFEAPIFRSS